MSAKVQAEYKWLATGAKIRVKNDTGTSGHEYLGSLVYKRVNGDLQLESTGFGGGRIEVSNGSSGAIYTPNYYFTDHLGSTRAIYNGSPDIARSDFLPFGTRWTNAQAPASRYQFTGYEDQDLLDNKYIDAGARFFNGIRFNNPDPLTGIRPWESPYLYCGANPVNRIDPNGMDWYIFNEETGRYERKQEADGQHRMVVRSLDKDGNEKYTFHDFNDPVMDAKAIENGKITNFERLSDSKIDQMMEASGIRTHDAQNSKWGYAYYQSQGLNMDYGHKGWAAGLLEPNSFYIREDIAYNIGDIGNYLWGWGMSELGFDVLTANIAAHGNNIFNGRKQGSELYYFGPGTYESSGFWDSPADQRAIKNGFFASPAGQKWAEKQRKLKEEALRRYLYGGKFSFSIM